MESVQCTEYIVVSTMVSSIINRVKLSLSIYHHIYELVQSLYYQLGSTMALQTHHVLRSKERALYHLSSKLIQISYKRFIHT